MGFLSLLQRKDLALIKTRRNLKDLSVTQTSEDQDIKETSWQTVYKEAQQ